jgi:uncharacterized protein YdeI (YjbR/CyaY-like superfamily)
MIPKFFAEQANFRKWLEENHDKETELLVGFYKVGTNKPSMNWSQSVDEALCFGWIDGVRRSIDAESYSIRFTPRKPNSVWSAVNIAKIEKLTEQNLMKPAGIAAFAKREERRSKIYAYENTLVELSAQSEKQFRANERAWSFFQKQSNSYRKRAIYWVMTAKRDLTGQNRLIHLINASAEQKKI